jgi:hypothetical protein
MAASGGLALPKPSFPRVPRCHAQDQNPHGHRDMNLAPRPLTAATLSVRMGTSRYGNPEPQIEVRFPRTTHHRQLHAALHLLAAAIEMATPRSERWCAQTEGHDTSGRVFLELGDATEAEAQRGLAVLTAVREQALAS